MYDVSLRIVSPAAYRGDRYGVGWAFTPACDSGACSVSVSTVATACASGSCSSPPSLLEYADEPLRLAHGSYHGTFKIATGCTASDGTHFPYAYVQGTTLSLRPLASRAVGAGRSGRQVTKLAGTPNSTGRKFHCAPYRIGLSLTAIAQNA